MSAEERVPDHRAGVAIRVAREEDYAAIAEVSNLLDPDDRTTAEELRFDADRFSKQGLRSRWCVACNIATGAIDGTARYNHRPWEYDPHRFSVWIGVRPERQRRGIGRALYERLLGDLTELGATALRAGARETDAAPIAFLEHRGFQELHRSWESRLDLASFDPTRFTRYAAPPRGIEITTLAEELGRDPERLRDVHALVNRLVPDAPYIDPPTPSAFEWFRASVLGPWGLPEGYFLAKNGDTYVGQSDLSLSDAMPEDLFTGFTGVVREYRGRGLAMALKVRALTFAKDRGYQRVRTYNSTLNVAMVAINMKLGFVKRPVWIIFGKNLKGEAAP